MGGFKLQEDVRFWMHFSVLEIQSDCSSRMESPSEDAVGENRQLPSRGKGPASEQGAFVSTRGTYFRRRPGAEPRWIFSALLEPARLTSQGFGDKCLFL